MRPPTVCALALFCKANGRSIWLHVLSGHPLRPLCMQPLRRSRHEEAHYTSSIPSPSPAPCPPPSPPPLDSHDSCTHGVLQGS
jgi:hypothetical protein